MIEDPKFKQACHPLDYPKVLAEYRKYVLQREFFIIRCRIRVSKAGRAKYQWFIIYGGPEFNEIGEFTGYKGGTCLEELFVEATPLIQFLMTALEKRLKSFEN
jgi:hypothetical protein